MVDRSANQRHSGGEPRVDTFMACGTTRSIRAGAAVTYVQLLTLPGGIQVGVFKTGTRPPASVAADAVDTYDEAAFVRNLRAIDGRESFPTQNSRSRRVTLRWSRVPEQQLEGYHVYRRCEWEYSEPAAASWPSHDGRDCVHSWVRLTDSPISSVRVFEDRPGGLNGAYLYSVRPVGPGATAGTSVEGPVFKLLELDLTTNGHEGNPNFEEDGVPAQCYDSVSTEDIDTKVSGGAQLEIDRINAIDKGTGSATGAPAQPANVVIQFRTQAPTSVLKTYTLRWDANTEADLAGYYVEMAGAANGPWERLNDQPVAWWETSFDVKGLDSDSVGPGACAHFRVIAVDDSGLESSPSDPIDEEYVATTPPTLLSYTPPSCGGFTLAPPAPQDLVVTTETLGASSPFHCENLLEWSEVSGASDYYIYRYAHYWTIGSWPTYSGYYFYRTHELPASSCSGGTCSYIESGDLPTGGSGVNDGCPWGDDNCYLDKLETYYVTAVYDNGSGGKSGESPRSALVFWNCSEFNGIEEGYTGLIDARPRVPAWFEREAFEESPILLADSRPAECPVEPASWPLAESPQLVLARPLTLGTVDPPYEVLDLHVDHLGSTRLMTDDLVTSTVRHDFFPFGEEMSPVLDLGSAKRFTGHERDRATGLDYMLARFYSAETARFHSPDSYIGSAWHEAPQTWNRYVYALNSPLGFVDPTGFEVQLTGATAEERTQQLDDIKESVGDDAAASQLEIGERSDDDGNTTYFVEIAGDHEGFRESGPPAALIADVVGSSDVVEIAYGNNSKENGAGATTTVAPGRHRITIDKRQLGFAGGVGQDIKTTIQHEFGHAQFNMRRMFEGLSPFSSVAASNDRALQTENDARDHYNAGFRLNVWDRNTFPNPGPQYPERVTH